jgi:hypothetical protein
MTDAKLMIFENDAAGDTGHANRMMLMTVTLIACNTTNAAAPPRWATTARPGRAASSGQRRARLTASGVRIASISQNGNAFAIDGSHCTGGPPIVDRR